MRIDVIFFLRGIRWVLLTVIPRGSTWVFNVWPKSEVQKKTLALTFRQRDLNDFAFNFSIYSFFGCSATAVKKRISFDAQVAVRVSRDT